MDSLSQLALDAANGDRDALGRFFAETQGDVWRLCRYLGGADVADDLTQETFERALRSIERYSGAGSARGWILTIARRVCADNVRRATRRRRRDQQVMSNATAGSASAPPLADFGSDGEVELSQLIEALSDDRRAAFVLTQEVGMRYEEAADVLGCPVGTVRSRVSRARADLLDMLDGGNEPGLSVD